MQITSDFTELMTQSCQELRTEFTELYFVCGQKNEIIISSVFVQTVAVNFLDLKEGKKMNCLIGKY